MLQFQQAQLFSGFAESLGVSLSTTSCTVKQAKLRKQTCQLLK